MLSLYILPNLPLHTPPCRNIPTPISGFGADVLCDVGEVLQGPPAMISPHQAPGSGLPQLGRPLHTSIRPGAGRMLPGPDGSLKVKAGGTGEQH